MSRCWCWRCIAPPSCGGVSQAPSGRGWLAVAAAQALALGAVFGKYYQVARRDHLVWTPKLARQWGASLLSYLQPDPVNTYAGIWPDARRRAREGTEAETEAKRPPRWLLAPMGLAALGCFMGELHTWSKVPPFEF